METKWTAKTVTIEKMLEQAQKLLLKGKMGRILINVQASAWSTVPRIRSNSGKDGVLANGVLSLEREDVDGMVEKVVGKSYLSSHLAL